MTVYTTMDSPLGELLLVGRENSDGLDASGCARTPRLLTPAACR